jgi:hypothetical protein
MQEQNSEVVMGDNSLQSQVDEIKALLALNGISESTSSVQDESANVLAEMTTLANDVNEMVAALGLTAGLDENGDELLTISNDMVALGDTTLSDVTVTGDFLAGLVKIDSIESSIDVLGPECYNPETGVKDGVLCDTQTLYLQKSLAGNVDILDGTVSISPDGLLNVEGEVRAEKYAVSNKAVTDASAGKAVMLAGETSVLVNTTALNDNSLIFVTPDRPVLVGSQKTGTAGEFEITLDKKEREDVIISWWIVDSYDELVETGGTGDTVATTGTGDTTQTAGTTGGGSTGSGTSGSGTSGTGTSPGSGGGTASTGSGAGV